jgi:hypothetical protein
VRFADQPGVNDEVRVSGYILGPFPTESVASVVSSDWGVPNDKAVRVRPGAARSNTHSRDGLGPDVWHFQDSGRLQREERCRLAVRRSQNCGA